MRRTLFVFPRDLLSAAWGSASARVADTERKRVAKDVVLAGLAADGDVWLDEARAAVLEELASDPTGVTAWSCATGCGSLGQDGVPAGASWAGRVLTHLGATAHVVRGANTQHWRLSRPRWTRMEDWLADVPDPLSTEEGYAELVRRWLGTFGPGTEADLVWWLGATKGAVRRALTDVEAVEVSFDGGGTGWVLPDDLDTGPTPARGWLCCRCSTRR